MHQAKIRINDLAREMEVKSKSILDALPLAGIFKKKTHSSSLDADDADKVRAYFQDLSHVSRPGDVLKAIAQRTKTPPASVAQSAISFDYLTQLQRHVVELARNPSQWMPWNYHARLERSGVSVDSG
jgi:hypothetical protein